MRLQICPPPGATLPPLTQALTSCGLLALGSALVWLAGRSVDKQRGTRRLPWLVLAALLCALASCVLDLLGWRTGPDPAASAWAAAIAALAAYQGLHIAVLAVVGPYLALRAWRGHLGPRSRATLDNIGLLWHYTTLQGIAVVAVVRLMPLLMA
jgi:cytochrome c oxidase subunit I+III